MNVTSAAGAVRLLAGAARAGGGEGQGRDGDVVGGARARRGRRAPRRPAARAARAAQVAGLARLHYAAGPEAHLHAPARHRQHA